MSENKFKLVVSKPMRVDMSGSPIGGPDIAPSLEITADENITRRLIKSLYEYKLKYYDKPASFLLSPHEYLSLCADLALTQGMPPRFTDDLIFHGLPVRAVVEGLEINPKHLSRIAWEQTK